MGSKFHYVLMVFFYWAIFFILLPLVHAYILRFKNMISFCTKKNMISFELIKICGRTLVYQIEKITQLKFSLKYWISFTSLKNAFPMFYKLCFINYQRIWKSLLLIWDSGGMEFRCGIWRWVNKTLSPLGKGVVHCLFW